MKRREVLVHREILPPRSAPESGEFDVKEVLPGSHLQVAELFGEDSQALEERAEGGVSGVYRRSVPRALVLPSSSGGLSGLGWELRLRLAAPRRGALRALKNSTGGMLRAKEYQMLAYMARRSPEGNFVEVGAGYGTSTIILGREMLRRRTAGQVVTFEKGRPTSKGVEPELASDLSTLRENLERNGVDAVVRVESIHLKLNDSARNDARSRVPRPISLLSLDADGEIYRDFWTFFDLMGPDCCIVIDDYGLDSEIGTAHTAQHQRKFIKTRRYVDLLVERGFIEPIVLSHRTLFARKPGGNAPGAPLTMEEGLSLERALGAEISRLGEPRLQSSV